MKPDNFTSIPQTWDNIDMYVIRTCIWNAIQKCAPQFNGHLLDVGCGRKPYRQFLLDNKYITHYTGLDIASAIVYEDGIKPDFTWDGTVMPFEDNSFDTLMATEVLEHCPDPYKIINEMKRVLKPGGIIFFTVPFLWNLHEVPYDEYRYTPFSLRRIFKECNLENVELFAHGGWNMSMAQMIGMWIVATKKGSARKRWAKLLNPVVKRLMKKDTTQQPVLFSDGMMINGLYGLVKKQSA
jgi:SAM-dependent methyltransferase